MLKECTCGSVKALHAEIARLNKVKAEERVKEMEDKLEASLAQLKSLHATVLEQVTEELKKQHAREMCMPEKYKICNPKPNWRKSWMAGEKRAKDGRNECNLLLFVLLLTI